MDPHHGGAQNYMHALPYRCELSLGNDCSADGQGDSRSEAYLEVDLRDL